MADNIVELDFTNDAFSGGGSQGTYSGSIQVDYTANTFSGTVTVVDSAGTNTFPASGGLSGGPNGAGSYQLNVGGISTGYQFTLGWTGETPTSGSANYTDYTHGLSFANGQYGGSDPAGPITSTAVACFGQGTLIRTARGDVPVEDLLLTDDVLTASGGRRAIRWLGHRVLDCRRHPTPLAALPIRIAAHAFGDDRPARDLYVSPGHAICVDVVGEVLIPAGMLVNGSTITQVDVEKVTYWHVELDSHDILLAENLPSESYIEMGNRDFFFENDAIALAGTPDAPTRTHADFCRTFVNHGLVLNAVRARLRARAEEMLGWVMQDDAVAGAHLIVDGRRLEPKVAGLTARFIVPAGATTAWLVSKASRPSEVIGTADDRLLGVCLRSLTIDDGRDVFRVIGSDDERLCVGFHECESGTQRWTAGRALLARELWEDCEGAFVLHVELAGPSVPQWVTPSAPMFNTSVALAI